MVTILYGKQSRAPRTVMKLQIFAPEKYANMRTTRYGALSPLDVKVGSGANPR